ncbi:MAG: 3'(2'),5'-bisphosphate nucleotidase CysQ [Patescibacteria group bacterium]|nr:3'(2'),5'-bisphosphate nucleotidase CysQ [Patescibacteria group bacterium]
MNKELQTAMNTAKRAGEAIMEMYDGEFNTKQKDDNSPVTEADITSQKIIFEGLKSFGYGFIGEESEKKEISEGHCWIVDPLDRTKDFINKTDDFSVMIGLVENGKVILGIVYVLARDIFYFAEKGKGAYKKTKNQKPKKINCSLVSELNNTTMVVSRFHLDEETKSFIDKAKIKKTLPTGSIGVKMSLIAEGKADIYITTTDKTFLWDVCSADIILQEAGGMITDINEKQFSYKNNLIRNNYGIVATTKSLQSEVVKNLASIGI